jgi:hypothetical protein
LERSNSKIDNSGRDEWSREEGKGNDQTNARSSSPLALLFVHEHAAALEGTSSSRSPLHNFCLLIIVFTAADKKSAIALHVRVRAHASVCRCATISSLQLFYFKKLSLYPKYVYACTFEQYIWHKILKLKLKINPCLLHWLFQLMKLNPIQIQIYCQII